MTPTSPPSVPVDVRWHAPRGETQAHAYSAGPGWTRSVCRARVWNVALGEDERAPRCFECADLLAERIPESELAAMDGSR